MKLFCRFQTSILILHVFDIFSPLLDPRPPTLVHVFFLGVKQTTMKRIQIRRKKRKPETPPPPPEPVDDESSETSEFEDDVQTEPPPPQSEPHQQLRNLSLADEQRSRSQALYQTPVREPRRANVARTRPNFAPDAPKKPTWQQRQPSVLGAPRSQTYDRPRKRPSGRPKWRFRSAYGPNGHLLSTQDKARMLYFSAFG